MCLPGLRARATPTKQPSRVALAWQTTARSSRFASRLRAHRRRCRPAAMLPLWRALGSAAIRPWPGAFPWTLETRSRARCTRATRGNSARFWIARSGLTSRKSMRQAFSRSHPFWVLSVCSALGCSFPWSSFCRAAMSFFSCCSTLGCCQRASRTPGKGYAHQLVSGTQRVVDDVPWAPSICHRLSVSGSPDHDNPTTVIAG
mmetsp:Transcript_49506/g.80280  ORF Transcript_49506/g.80280 Transcript_49506/m.80280 type:complete len:202 (-) Transcript_49506:255-860(-)